MNEATSDSLAKLDSKEKRQFWYPIKLILPPNRSRQIMIEDRHTRKQVLKTILRMQGFETQLE